VQITAEALSMLYTRYRYAATHCPGMDVLEVACGAGQGLGYLAKNAKRVIGGDSTLDLLKESKRHYRSRIPLVGLDAHFLPFRNQSFDTVLLYEAIYYLSDHKRFLSECHRVLRSSGALLICTVNKEWPDFHPSPYSTCYFSAQELAALLLGSRYTVTLFGLFPVVRTSSTKDSFISLAKQSATKFNLIPKTMRGKEALKRLFFGPLYPVPTEVQDGMAPYCQPVPISDPTEALRYKVLLALAHPDGAWHSLAT